MYGKHFTSMYSGSMMGAGPVVFAVWGYVISHAQKDRVEINPRLLATLLGCKEKEILDAIEYLTKPDPDSRCKEHQGRRMVKEGQYQYFLPSAQTYREMRNEDERREYNRQKQAEYRAKNAECVQTSMTEVDSQQCQQMSSACTNTEAELKAELKTDINRRRIKRVVVDADIQEIFDHWHSDDLVWQDPQTKADRCRCPQTNQPWKTSKELTPDIIDNIKQHLGKWKVDQLITAVEHYHQIFTSAEHGKWTFRWSISEFFGRHMPNDRSQFAFYRFLPNNFDADRYKGKLK